MIIDQYLPKENHEGDSVSDFLVVRMSVKLHILGNGITLNHHWAKTSCLLNITVAVFLFIQVLHLEPPCIKTKIYRKTERN